MQNWWLLSSEVFYSIRGNTWEQVDLHLTLLLQNGPSSVLRESKNLGFCGKVVQEKESKIVQC